MSRVFEALLRAEKEQVKVPREETKKASRQEGAGDIISESPFHALEVDHEPKPSDGKISPWLVTYWHLGSAVVEQIKRIRTHICYGTQRPSPPRAIMVTSAISGEGKSLVMANLGIGIAQGLNDYVLLIDSDIRKSHLHTYFNKPQVPGLSDYLSGETELASIIRPTGIPKVTFIPGGRQRGNPIELLSSRRMMELVYELRERYEDRFVLFDSTPVLLTNEPVVLSKMMDGILFIVRHGMTPRDAVNEALALLTKEKLIGLVFNDSPPELSRPYRYGGRVSCERGGYRKRDAK